MTNVHYLYYDRWINATYRLLDYVADSAREWYEMPSYRKEGRLLYLKQLGPNLSILRSGLRQGKLSKQQAAHLRNLERLAQHAFGTIKFLSDEYELQKGDDAH